MAEKTIKEVIPELTDDQLRALEAAGVKWAANLAAMNVDDVAGQTQIPAQTLAAWKLKAEQATTPPKATATAVKKRGFWTARRIGWLLFLLSWAAAIFLIWYSTKIRQAAQDQETKIQSPLMQWVRYGAGEAVNIVNGVDGARVLIKNQNFGAAQEALRKAQTLVSMMNDTVPAAEQGAIRDAAGKLSDATNKLPDHPEDALSALDDFAVALSKVQKVEAAK